jgi:RNA recognition motif-containing protein
MGIFCGNLPFTMTDAELEQQFSKFGTVADVHILRDPQGQSRGMGFVTMRDASASSAALRCGAFEYMGRMVYVRTALRRGVSRRKTPTVK